MFACSQCAKGFKRERHLKKHIARYHQGARGEGNHTESSVLEDDADLDPEALASSIVHLIGSDDAGAVDSATVLSDDDMAGGCLPPIEDILAELAMPPPLSPLPIYPPLISQEVGTLRVRRVMAAPAPLTRKARQEATCIAAMRRKPTAQRRYPPSIDDLILLVSANRDKSVLQLMHESIAPLKLPTPDVALTKDRLRTITRTLEWLASKP